MGWYLADSGSVLCSFELLLGSMWNEGTIASFIAAGSMLCVCMQFTWRVISGYGSPANIPHCYLLDMKGLSVSLSCAIKQAAT